jgi:hypothetical protein
VPAPPTATLAYRPLHLQELGMLSHLPPYIAGNIRSMEKAVDMHGSFLTIRDSHLYLIHQSAGCYEAEVGKITV